jgi:hypothetical protein
MDGIFETFDILTFVSRKRRDKKEARIGARSE